MNTKFTWSGLGGGIRGHHRLAGRTLLAIQRLDDQQLDPLQSNIFVFGDYRADDSGEVHVVVCIPFWRIA